MPNFTPRTTRMPRTTNPASTPNTMARTLGFSGHTKRNQLAIFRLVTDFIYIQMCFTLSTKMTRWDAYSRVKRQIVIRHKIRQITLSSIHVLIIMCRMRDHDFIFTTQHKELNMVFFL